MEDLSATQGKLRGDAMLWAVCAHGKCAFSLTKSLSFRLCLSITDFHPDTWNPAWSVSTILTGLLSFMVEKGPTLGSIETSDFTVRCGSGSPGALWHRGLQPFILGWLCPETWDSFLLSRWRLCWSSTSTNHFPVPGHTVDISALAASGRGSWPHVHLCLQLSLCFLLSITDAPVLLRGLCKAWWGDTTRFLLVLFL